jgi:hypothetical protein
VFVAVMGVLMCGFLLGGLIYELKTGTLVVRGWKVYAHRHDNPTLYWSGVIIEIVLAFIFLVFGYSWSLGMKIKLAFDFQL